MPSTTRPRHPRSPLLLVALALAACGGSSSSPPQPPATFSLSGTVSGAGGVTVTLGGGGAAPVVADGAGHYAFSGLPAGHYTVTPSKSGYVFTPPSHSVTLSASDATGLDFTATATQHTVSGTVTGASGVLVDLTKGFGGYATSTDGTGHFSMLAEDGAWTLQPLLAGYRFSPLSRALLVAGADLPGCNFTAVAAPTTWSIGVQVSGAIQVGVLLTLTQGGTALGDAYSNGAGFHDFAGLLDGTYVVTPTAVGYHFTPSSTQVTVAGADAPVQAFTAVAGP